MDVLKGLSNGGGEINIKKLIKSLIVVSIAGLSVIVATQAFFSDTETSVGNKFEAGKIDLKVDHVYASYNDRECEQNCVEQQGELVQNISFEAPVVATAQLWDINDSPVGGWNVEWTAAVPATFNSVDRPVPAHLEYHKGVLGSAHEGQQYVELDSDWDGPGGGLNNEPASVTIYQDITTTPGGKYKLRFAFAPRPNTLAATNRLEVKWDGVVVWDSGNVGDPNAGIEWQYKEFDVTATGNSTELRFTDLGTADSYGTFIDNITMHEVICEVQLEDPLCNVWSEKDLEEGDIFWNFDDIKPGDRGRNVISMHVYDNNYWACLLSDKQDLENTIIDPEAEAGDVTDPEGELSNYVHLFIWTDGNQNGQYEPGLGEEAVHEDGFPDVLPLDEPADPPLLASTTYYYGVAWCVGTQTVHHDTGLIECSGEGNQNDAQTDTLNVDLKFYVEQSRNNPNFSCQSLVQEP